MNENMKKNDTSLSSNVVVTKNYKFTTCASWNPHKKWQFLGFTVFLIMPIFLDKDKIFFYFMTNAQR